MFMNESRSVVLDLEKVKAWMGRDRWTVGLLAQRLGICKSTMSRYLTGKAMPPYPVVIALSALSGMAEAEIAPPQAA
jgi:transcriptional regulator with XRE-family HTH domain